MIDTLPRFRAAQLPTPLEEAKRLSDALGGPRILLKRDDLTGAGLGGNKVRKLEYIVGAAIAEGADTLVVCGGYQSNLARIASALGARAGLKVELVLGGVPGEPRPIKGNLLLDGLLGARVHFVETIPRWEFGAAIEDVAEDVRRRGGKPFVMPLGGSSPAGMAGYVRAVTELNGQLSAMDARADYLVAAIGSGGTYSGLILGAVNQNVSWKTLGVSVSRTAEYLVDKMVEELPSAAAQLGLQHVPSRSDLLITDEYIGEGYGVATEGGVEAIKLLGRTEGILLDQVYSGKAFHALADWIAKGRIGKTQTVVFLLSGGVPALFAESPEIFGISNG